MFAERFEWEVDHQHWHITHVAPRLIVLKTTKISSGSSFEEIARCSVWPVEVNGASKVSWWAKAGDYERQRLMGQIFRAELSAFRGKLSPEMHQPVA
jgi:hypothetical protein